MTVVILFQGRLLTFCSMLSRARYYCHGKSSVCP